MRAQLEEDILLEKIDLSNFSVDNLPNRPQLAADVGESVVSALAELNSIESE